MSSDYADKKTHPSLTAIVFVSFIKLFVVWHYHDELRYIGDLLLLSAFLDS